MKRAVALFLLYVLMMWLISGMSRSAGLLVWLTGMAALLCCFIALRFGQRRPLFAVYLTAGNLALFVAVAELILRLAPGVLHGAIANHAYSGYHCSPGGIYARDDRLGFALKPGSTTMLYWNGHWWRHETNAAGFRGPPVDRADVVFLGDSMIYGHGVEDGATVPDHFARLQSCTVANLGQQGTCLVQMCARLRQTGLPLTPKVAFVCCHYNDIGEACYWYDEEELRRFLADDNYEPRARSSFRPRPAWRLDHHVWDDHIAPPLRLTGALDAGVRLIANPHRAAGVVEPAERFFRPSPDKLNEAFAPWDESASFSDRLGWQVHCAAIRRIEQTCAAHGIRLILFDIGYPHAFSQAIEQYAKSSGIEYSTAGRVALEQALSGDDIYLANDGHWSANGCAVIARELKKMVESQ